MEAVKLGINVDAREVTAATEALSQLAVAAERASQALDNLASKEHGGIAVKVVGAVAHVEIAPPKVEITGKPISDFRTA